MLSRLADIDDGRKLAKQATIRIADQRLHESPIVSVVLLTFNHANFVEKSLKSVCEQDASFPYEIIIGDDCSCDGTEQLVREYQKRYPERILLLLANENLGQYTKNGRINMIRCLDACRGKYVAPLEGDDYWTSTTKLQTQFDQLEANPNCSLSHHRVQLVDEFNRPKGFSKYSFASNCIGLKELLQVTSNRIFTSSMFYRRSAFPEFPREFFWFPLADWPIACALTAQGDALFIDEVMSCYRVHEGGIWSKKSVHHRSWQKLRMIKSLRRYFSADLAEYFDRLILKLRLDLADGLKINGQFRRASKIRWSIISRHPAQYVAHEYSRLPTKLARLKSRLLGGSNKPA